MRRDLSEEEKRQLKRFGKLLLSLSGQQAKSLERIAYEAGLSKSYFYDLVNGKGNPSLIVLLKLADIFEMPLWKILKSINA